jgi:hypothetical protein
MQALINTERSNETGPIEDVKDVTPSDSTDLPYGTARGFLFQAAGTLRVTTAKGTTQNFSGLSANTLYPIAVKRVHSTGTTATGIKALY